ncbi:hypothetical protein NL676_010170 [Syzygium grande]|nr:hypothetical protein NL676_010170 [Syzygium grande]
MGNRRFAQFATSDEEEDEEPHPRKRVTRSSKNPVESEAESRGKRRKLVKLGDGDGDEGGDGADREGGREEEKGAKNGGKRKKKKEEEEEQEEVEVEEPEEEEDADEDAKPIGEPVRFSSKGRGRRSHYVAFEFDGNQYELEDPVLLVPVEKDQKPYVAIIKDIAQTTKGSIMVTGQWFYRPEEAEKKGGGSWQSRDTRELFYSFHRDEVPAESVMHKCVVHFVPIHKQLPHRKQNPGFIVQKVYDTVEKKLWKLTDKDYEDNKQHEIDLLVQKTLQRLGDLPDIDTEDAHADQEDQLKRKRSFRRRNVSPLDVSREEDSTAKSDQQSKAETPGSCTSNASEYYAILVKFNELTGSGARDKWLERLLQAVQYVCTSDGTNDEDGTKCSEGVNGSQEQKVQGEHPLIWPDAAVSAVTALEKASHQTLSLDFQKYNQKLRQLLFNLKSTALLARRLLNGELEPSKILNMSPSELKEGLTAEETARKEPEESECMQMTDARCSRCSEFKVGVRDIIQAGHGDRYQLECIACGHSWYASRDAVSMLTIDGPSSTRSVGTAPWATTKFESVEKQLASPRESTKPPDDAFKKSTEAKIPVLERQKSVSKPKLDENSEITK